MSMQLDLKFYNINFLQADFEGCYAWFRIARYIIGIYTEVLQFSVTQSCKSCTHFKNLYFGSNDFARLELLPASGFGLAFITFSLFSKWNMRY